MNRLTQLNSIQPTNLVSLQVVMDPVSGMSKGFGFVRFSSEEEKDRVRGARTHARTACMPYTTDVDKPSLAPSTTNAALTQRTSSYTHVPRRWPA